MASFKRVALVTGGNKGIGYNIVSQLARHDSSLLVLLGSRDAARGQSAVQQLHQAGLNNVALLSFDATNSSSIDAAVQHIQSTYGGLDLLCNNAGIFLKDGKDEGGDQDAVDQTLAVNYYAVVEASTKFLPIIKQNGRIVSVASQLGLAALNNMSPQMQKQFTSQTNIDGLNSLIRSFRDSFVSKTISQSGWCRSAYGVSKLGVMMASHLLGQQCARDNSGVTLNSACPGWCKTDMTSDMAPRSAAEGASMITHVLTLPQEQITNGAFWENKHVSWKL